MTNGWCVDCGEPLTETNADVCFDCFWDEHFHETRVRAAMAEKDVDVKADESEITALIVAANKALRGLDAT